jgi:hypothetical protein
VKVSTRYVWTHINTRTFPMPIIVVDIIGTIQCTW